MSRSFNEISVPNVRGRFKSKKAIKRRSSKLLRASENIDTRTDKIMRKKFIMDSETLGINFDKKKNYLFTKEII